MPLRLAPETVATPLLLVVAEPAFAPLTVKLTVLPPTPEVPAVRVAVRSAVPPYVPVADETASEVVVGATTRMTSEVAAPSANFGPVLLLLETRVLLFLA